MAAKRLTKKKATVKESKRQAKKAAKRVSKRAVSVDEYEKRSAAAKKGWETRRSRAVAKLQEKSVRLSRSEIAKKAWATRRAKAAALLESKKRRSKAAKRAWDKRKAEVQQLEIQPHLERKDLRLSLPSTLKKIKEKQKEARNNIFKQLFEINSKKLEKMSRKQLLEHIRLAFYAEKAYSSTSKKAVLAWALIDEEEYCKAQAQNVKKFQDLANKTALDHFDHAKYGTEIEAFNIIDKSLEMFIRDSLSEESDEAKLRKFINNAYGTPQFDALIRTKAYQMGKSARQIYSFMFGSPDADLFL